MRTKPILAFIGSKGSGKSITNRKVGLILFGDAFDVMPLTDDSKDCDSSDQLRLRRDRQCGYKVRVAQ